MDNASRGDVRLHFETGGSGGPALLLIHGANANGAVWRSMRPYLDRWPGRWIAPDLRGHGRSPHATPYGFGNYAADIAALFEQNEEIVVLGHSMGGAIAMMLASQHFGVVVREVFAFGVKMHWSEEEIAKTRALAATPLRWFDSKRDAVERYLKVSGLHGLVEPASFEAMSGVIEEQGRFRLRADMRAAGAAGVPLQPLVRAVQSPLRLAAGSRDPMVAVHELTEFDRTAHLFENCGHNPHVERPEMVWEWIRSARS